MTSSPGPIPSDSKATWSACVPLVRRAQNRDPLNLAHSRAKRPAIEFGSDGQSSHTPLS